MTTAVIGPQRLLAPCLTIAATGGCDTPSANPAPDADARSAVAVAQAFLEALSRSDTIALALHAIPSTRLVALPQDPAAEPRITSFSDFLVQVHAASGTYMERMWSAQAHVEGRLATIWGPYDFHRDGVFSHCGIDSFDMVRMGHSWKVLSLVYTIQTEGCTESPLGPITSQ